MLPLRKKKKCNGFVKKTKHLSRDFPGQNSDYGKTNCGMRLQLVKSLVIVIYFFEIEMYKAVIINH